MRSAYGFMLLKPRIDSGFSDFRQFLVGSLFFLKVRLKDIGAVIAAERPGPGDERAIACKFIMLDRLRCRDQSCVENLLILQVDVTGDLFGFLKNTIDSRAIYRLAFGVMHLEDL